MEYLAARLTRRHHTSAFKDWAALVIFRQLKAEKDEHARMADDKMGLVDVQLCIEDTVDVSEPWPCEMRSGKVEGDVRRRLEKTLLLQPDHGRD